MGCVSAAQAKASCDGFLRHPILSPGDALLDAGESMKRLAEVKDSLDIEVKQNFIDPLQNLCDKDLKEIQVRGAAPGPPLLLPTHPPAAIQPSSGHVSQREGLQGIRWPSPRSQARGVTLVPAPSTT